MWNFQGSWFLASDFLRDLTKICGVSRTGALLCLKFSGVKWKNEKFQTEVFQNVQTPCLYFFWNSSMLALSRVERYTFARKPAVSIMSCGMLFTRVGAISPNCEHYSILLLKEYWLGTETFCRSIGQHWR